MGTEIWKVNVGASVTSNPICNSEKIYVATIAGNCSCLSAKNGLIFWSCSLNSPVFGSPFISNDKIYWPSVVGTVNCISCADGKKVNIAPQFLFIHIVFAIFRFVILKQAAIFIHR